MTTTRERIVHASFDVFDNLDFHKATIREIAKRSGIAPASIYKHFASKDDLVMAITNEKTKQMITELNEHFIGVRGTMNKLRKMTWYYLYFYENNPQVSWVVNISTSVKSWRESSDGWKNVRQTGQTFMGILREGQKLGDVRQDINIFVMSNIYFGGLARLVQIWLVHNQSYSLTALADDFAETIFAAVRTPTE
ncbi:MAG: TetR/AcrR family transcriptional regulator [Dehalococcoidia bacterium]|nr:MAG: TetR/AcrR family transcriptional regulator [Dehalococcoidia bacterium]